MDDIVVKLKALAEPTRLRIVRLCRSGGDLAVSEFVRILGQSQPRVSRHLRLLTEAGVLSRLPEGSWVFYRISELPGIAAVIDAVLAEIPPNDTTIARDIERLSQVKAERRAVADAYFSANAAAWGEIRALHVDQEEVNAALRAMLGNGQIESLLDIGTGTGEMLHLLADKFARGEGIDMSRDMLSVARAKLEEAGLEHCRVRQGDLFTLPYPDASFDAVILHQVLHYIDDINGAVAEAARVLKPGGCLLVADFARHDIEQLRTEDQHRRLGISKDDMDGAFARAGLTGTTVRDLKGDPLTVTVWRAERTAAKGQ